jgi:hypothetical protein
MGIFQIVLILATFLCSLVAGFLFAFALVVGHISVFPGGRLPVCFCLSGDAGHKKFK